MINIIMRNDLPCNVGAMLTPNEDGSHTILLNARLSETEQRTALHHEYNHILDPDASESEIHSTDFRPRYIRLKRCVQTRRYLSIKVAGVTYDTGGLLRQDLLRNIRMDMDNGIWPHSVSLQTYLFGVEPAIYVLLNNVIIGNVPRNMVDEVLSAKIAGLRSVSVYGGQDSKSLGCIIEIWLK